MFLHKSTLPALFSFGVNDDLAEVGLGVAESDVLFNFTTAESQAMNGSVPWRGAHEKDTAFLQMLISALTKPGSLVLDAFASIGI